MACPPNPPIIIVLLPCQEIADELLALIRTFVSSGGSGDVVQLGQVRHHLARICPSTVHSMFGGSWGAKVRSRDRDCEVCGAGDLEVRWDDPKTLYPGRSSRTSHIAIHPPPAQQCASQSWTMHVYVVR